METNIEMASKTISQNRNSMLDIEYAKTKGAVNNIHSYNNYISLQIKVVKNHYGIFFHRESLKLSHIVKNFNTMVAVNEITKNEFDNLLSYR
jgi:hypothetical protein